MDSIDSAAACNLGTGDYRQRLQWIRQLNAAALRGYHREGARIELTYDPAQAARVREFVRDEQECCPFLEFSVHEGESAVIVTIDAPDQTAEAAEELFARRVAT